MGHTTSTSPVRARAALAGRKAWALAVGLLALWLQLGCGTTRWSDTARTATEQLLISNAIDRAVSEFDFAVLAGKEVFFDASYLRGTTDENYIVSSLRQHMLANGCILRESKEQAEYVIEARSGGVGTDRSDLLFGVPSVSVPSVPGVPLPSTIPEIPFAKSTNQKAVAKIAVFAYNRETGRPVLQSGVAPITSTAKNSWIFGAGPFQRGTVYEGTKFAGDKLRVPIIGGRTENRSKTASITVTAPFVFPENVQDKREQLVGPDGKPIERMAQAPDKPKASTAPPPAPTPAPPPTAPPPTSGPQSGVSGGFSTTTNSSGGVAPRLDLSKFGPLLESPKN